MKCVEKAYAKVNLTLAVGEKRPDGYHEVVSVMQRVSLHDTLTAEQTREGITLTCSDPALPSGEENLAHRAASLFFRETGIAGGAALTLEKRIPSQAGLGGGSSDAASVLLALRKLYAPALSDTELETMAAALGSDVPFFIRGGTQLATGRGEVLSPLPPLTDGWFVIVKPTESFSTPAMYRRLDNLPPACTPPLPPLQGGLPALAAGLFNRFEAAIPAGSAVWDIKAQLAAYGALASLLSGSGSAVFGLFDTETAARAAVEALRPAWPEIFLARPV
mgnify:FL=1